jgi:hypothetical protein
VPPCGSSGLAGQSSGLEDESQPVLGLPDFGVHRLDLLERTSSGYW